MDTVQFTKNDGGIGILTLNRPHVRNALNWNAMEKFAETIDRISDDEEMSALIITGSEGAFCAGGDLYELDSYLTRQDGRRLTTLMGKALKRLEHLPFPTLAAMEGPAIGGGAEIALACDLRVMAEKAVIGLSHIRLAIMPAWGGGQRLLHLIGYTRALEWLTAGRIVSSIEAHTAGLANRLVPDGRAFEYTLELAESITKHARRAVRTIKSILRAGIDMPAKEAEAFEREKFPEIWASAEHVKASKSFVEKKLKKGIKIQEKKQVRYSLASRSSNTYQTDFPPST